mgnify:CR=1 FL=1
MMIMLTNVAQGLLWAIMAIGVYLTFRVLNIADMTAEGSFPLGAAISARLIVSGSNPIVATLAGAAGGALAGVISGWLNTKLKIPDLLTGILTMTGLYSVNLLIMKAANISFLGHVKTVFNSVSAMSSLGGTIIFSSGLVLVLITSLVLFFRTEVGLAARAVGDNPLMSAANGINTDRMKIIVYMISNSFIALSGSLMAQTNGYADVSMGIGTLVIALSAIIMAEMVFHKSSLGKRFLTIVGGAIVYRWLIAGVLELGVDPNLLRLFYAVMLVLFLSIPRLDRRLARFFRSWFKKEEVSK